jgi:two-component system chemotaxis response regulator CheY
MRLSYYPATLQYGKKLKIDYSQIPLLVVDDDPTAVLFCSKLLNRIGFSDIGTAFNGLEAFMKMKERKYAAVISDWNMPEMTGLDLVRRIRADDQLKRTPFLMTSVDGAVERARLARQAGVNAFILKPFNATMLGTKLGEVLRPLPAVAA